MPPPIFEASLTSLEVHFPVWTDHREVAAVATGIKSLTNLRRLLLVSPEPCLRANRRIFTALSSLTSVRTLETTDAYSRISQE